MDGENPFSFILSATGGTSRGRSETVHCSSSNNIASKLPATLSSDSLCNLVSGTLNCETPSKSIRGIHNKTNSPVTGGKKLLKTNSFRRMDSPGPSTVTPQKQQPTLAISRNRSSSKENKPLYNVPPSSSAGPGGRAAAAASLPLGGPSAPATAAASTAPRVLQLALAHPQPPTPASNCKTLNRALQAKNCQSQLCGPAGTFSTFSKSLMVKQREAVRKIRNQKAQNFSVPVEASAEEVEVVRRRQSIAITTEIKNLVRAAAAEVAEEDFGDLLVVPSPPASPVSAASAPTRRDCLLSPPGSAESGPRISDVLDGRKRESLALDSVLIGKMLPRKVQLQVRQGKPVPPEFFGDVSIFFSDVVGFTNISAAVEPIHVIRLLVSYTV